MEASANGDRAPQRTDSSTPPPVRVAATADVHARESRADELRDGLAGVSEHADLLVIAGDLTSHGTVAEAELLAGACAGAGAPVIAVLGNHDWHAGQRDAIVATLSDAGVDVLDPGHAVHCIRGLEVGIVGAKGFVGGFPGGHLPDFGEPLLREVYAETGRQVAALDDGLRAVAHCPLRIVALHYSPVEETLAGEPREIHAFLGSERLAQPIREHEPDLVVHGHAHLGAFEGRIDDVPVFNTSVEVTKRPYWVFELTPATASASPLH